MSAELLLETASLIRERAHAATPGPAWQTFPTEVAGSVGWGIYMPSVKRAPAFIETQADAEHIASWHRVVALAVADWLERTAAWGEVVGYDTEPPRIDPPSYEGRMYNEALIVARAYLGRNLPLTAHDGARADVRKRREAECADSCDACDQGQVAPDLLAALSGAIERAKIDRAPAKVEATLAWAERVIDLETKRADAAEAALADIQAAFRASFTPDFAGVDWENGAAIQSFASSVSQSLRAALGDPS